MSNELLKSLGDETKLAQLLAKSPKAARKKDKHGSLPLHLALANKAPEATAKLLVGAFPEAAREKDKYGSLPLHVALASKAP